ncbi:MAG TPA: class I SAM-dependent methyltransferase, partial [Candidatus Tectomicrobia bacterium]
MSSTTDHNQLVREEFTRQAVAYAANPVIADPERLARLVQVVQPTADQRVLEVATGPGYVAMAFAAVAREVVGVDLTKAPLAIAEKRRQELGLHNVRFQLGDASRLQFADGEVEIVVCRLALH